MLGIVVHCPDSQVGLKGLFPAGGGASSVMWRDVRTAAAPVCQYLNETLFGVSEQRTGAPDDYMSHNAPAVKR